MVYRIAGGIALCLLAAGMLGYAVPQFLVGIVLLIAGVALLAGV